MGYFKAKYSVLGSPYFGSLVDLQHFPHIISFHSKVVDQRPKFRGNYYRKLRLKRNTLLDKVQSEGFTFRPSLLYNMGHRIHRYHNARINCKVE